MYSLTLHQLQLFLRGKPRLHERMKRLPNCYRKTPVAKDAKLPDFYEISKTSPLPEVPWSQRSKGLSIAPANPSAAARMTMNQFAMNMNLQTAEQCSCGTLNQVNNFCIIFMKLYSVAHENL